MPVCKSKMPTFYCLNVLIGFCFSRERFKNSLLCQWSVGYITLYTLILTTGSWHYCHIHVTVGANENLENWSSLLRLALLGARAQVQGCLVPELYPYDFTWSLFGLEWKNHVLGKRETRLHRKDEVRLEDIKCGVFRQCGDETLTQTLTGSCQASSLKWVRNIHVVRQESNTIKSFFQTRDARMRLWTLWQSHALRARRSPSSSVLRPTGGRPAASPSNLGLSPHFGRGRLCVHGAWMDGLPVSVFCLFIFFNSSFLYMSALEADVQEAACCGRRYMGFGPGNPNHGNIPNYPEPQFSHL